MAADEEVTEQCPSLESNVSGTLTLHLILSDQGVPIEVTWPDDIAQDDEMMSVAKKIILYDPVAPRKLMEVLRAASDVTPRALSLTCILWKCENMERDKMKAYLETI